MASPSAPPPPPPLPALPPPPNGEGSTEGTNTGLKAYGIDPERVMALYFQDLDARREDIMKMIREVERNAGDGYFSVRDFVESKINQTEVEITALEHRLEELKHLVEMTKSIGTLKNVPFPSDLHKKNFRELELNPRRFEIAKSLAYGTYSGAFSVGRQYGYQYYYEDQMRQIQLELDAARRTLRGFRIMREMHRKAIVEGRIDARNDTTDQKQNTKKDKGKKIQKDNKNNADGK